METHLGRLAYVRPLQVMEFRKAGELPRVSLADVTLEIPNVIWLSSPKEPHRNTLRCEAARNAGGVAGCSQQSDPGMASVIN